MDFSSELLYLNEMGSMMDDRTLIAIVKRMDEMEERLMAKIEKLQNFKMMVVGGSMVLSFIATIALELLKNIF